MEFTFQAKYENGVLRPVQPLALREGETVQLTATAPEPQPADDELVTRMKGANSLDELFAIANTQPTPPTDYDFCAALNENRCRDGALPVFPPEEKGQSW